LQVEDLCLDVLIGFIDKHYGFNFLHPFLDLVGYCELGGQALAKTLVCMDHRCPIEKVIVGSFVDMPYKLANHFLVFSDVLNHQNVAEPA